MHSRSVRLFRELLLSDTSSEQITNVISGAFKRQDTSAFTTASGTPELLLRVLPEPNPLAGSRLAEE